MENRKIVKRTYTIDNGEKCNKIMYAVAPRDMYGGECFHPDIEKAYLFKVLLINYILLFLYLLILKFTNKWIVQDVNLLTI